MQEYVYGKWVDYIGQKSMFVFDQIGLWLQKGIEPEVLVDIIGITAQAPMPSWRYAAAICRRAYHQKLTGMEEWQRDKDEWESKREQLPI